MPLVAEAVVDEEEHALQHGRKRSKGSEDATATKIAKEVSEKKASAEADFPGMMASSPPIHKSSSTAIRKSAWRSNERGRFLYSES